MLVTKVLQGAPQQRCPFVVVYQVFGMELPAQGLRVDASSMTQLPIDRARSA